MKKVIVGVPLVAIGTLATYTLGKFAAWVVITKLVDPDFDYGDGYRQFWLESESSI